MMKMDPKYGIDAQDVVDSIRSKIFLEDVEGLIKRLEDARRLYDSYDLPCIEDKYIILRLWPFRFLARFIQRGFRKLYLLNSVNQRKAFHLLVDEYRVLYVVLRNMESRTQSKFFGKK